MKIILTEKLMKLKNEDKITEAKSRYLKPIVVTILRVSVWKPQVDYKQMPLKRTEPNDQCKK